MITFLNSRNLLPLFLISENKTKCWEVLQGVLEDVVMLMVEDWGEVSTVTIKMLLGEMPEQPEEQDAAIPIDMRVVCILCDLLFPLKIRCNQIQSGAKGSIVNKFLISN